MCFFVKQANMLRKTKREELQYKKRGIGGERSPPHYVVSDHLLHLPSNYIVLYTLCLVSC